MKVQMLTNDFIEVMNKVQPYVAKDFSRPVLTKIHVKIDEKIMIEACDGYKGIRTYIEPTSKEAEPEDDINECLIPIVKITKSKACIDTITLEITKDRIRIIREIDNSILSYDFENENEKYIVNLDNIIKRPAKYTRVCIDANLLKQALKGINQYITFFVPTNPTTPVYLKTKQDKTKSTNTYEMVVLPVRELEKD